MLIYDERHLRSVLGEYADTGRTSPASNDRPISPHNRVLRWTCRFCGGRSSA